MVNVPIIICKENPRGLTISHHPDNPSLDENNKERVTIIEVDSELYDYDTVYQDITIDTEYKLWSSDILGNVFKNLSS